MTDQTDTRRRQDFEDQQNELAGRDTGRMTRFGVGNTRAQELKDREKKERAYRDALDRLLATDPEYRRLYEELGDKLGKAETQADNTIENLQAGLLAQQDANQDMLDRAPKVDGKAVFRTTDGRVVDEDGNRIDAIIAAGIIWPDDAPTAEEYFVGKAREDELSAALDNWQNYRNDTLGGIRDRYDDRDDPMSKQDLTDALDEISAKLPPSPDLNHANSQAVTPPSLYLQMPKLD
ncbi:MAG: hypothetical protein ABJD13_12035 [Paracoccaceae bacterium]